MFTFSKVVEEIADRKGYRRNDKFYNPLSFSVFGIDGLMIVEHFFRLENKWSKRPNPHPAICSIISGKRFSHPIVASITPANPSALNLETVSDAILTHSRGLSPAD